MVDGDELIVVLDAVFWIQRLLHFRVYQVGEVILIFIPLVIECAWNVTGVAIFFCHGRRL